MKERAIRFSSVTARAFLLVPVLLVIVGAWYAAGIGFGVAIGVGAPIKEVADIGKNLAPDNAMVHLASAGILEASFLPEDLSKALKEYETAVTLSSYDYRLWLELARAYDRFGEYEKSELAFKKSLTLAPNYSVVQWSFGNFLLRRGRTEEAFVLIRNAAKGDRTLIETAAALSWDLFDGDVSRIAEYFGDTPNLRAGLAVHLTFLKRFDEAIKIWKSIPAKSRHELEVADGTIVSRLMAAHQYRKAVEILKLRKESVLPRIGFISNSGFEEEISVDSGNVFEWMIGDSSGIHIGFDDTDARTGKRSLLIVFDTDGRTFRELSQVVVVDSMKTYRLSVSQKSDFRTSASMKWIVQNPMTGEVLSSTPVVAMASEWNDVYVDFIVPDGLEGVVIKLVRDGCNTQICPIYGKVWFDDVAVSRL